MALNMQEYLELQYACFLEYSVLLSPAEIDLFEKVRDQLVISSGIQIFIDESKKRAQEDLDLQFQTLSEAETARDDAIRLGDLARLKESELAVANEALKQKNILTEAQLGQEREFRLQQSRTGVQLQLVRFIVLLIGLAIIIPYVSRMFFVVDTNMSNSTGNALLLLINGLGIAIGSLFNRRNNPEEPPPIHS